MKGPQVVEGGRSAAVERVYSSPRVTVNRAELRELCRAANNYVSLAKLFAGKRGEELAEEWLELDRLVLKLLAKAEHDGLVAQVASDGDGPAAA